MCIRDSFGRSNEWAQQEHVALELSIYLRQNATQIAELGAVEIPRHEWERMADRAAYSRRYLGRTVDAFQEKWVSLGFLKRPDRQRFSLGDAPGNAEALASLIEAGERSIQGRKDGQASARARTASARAHARRRK